MCVLSASGNALKGLRHEGDVQSVPGKDVPDHVFHLVLIVRRLDGVGIFPVDFQLLHDVIIVPAVVHSGLHSAHFFVPHLNAEPVFVQDQ